MTKDKTPFEQAGYTKDTKFKCLVDYCNFKKGEIVKLHYDDNTLSPIFINSNGDAHYMALPTGEERELEVYVENVITPKLKFPCCVPTSEIKDEATLKTLTDLFEANGARVVDGVDLDGRVEFERVDCWEYFGVSVRDGGIFRTDFYDNAGSYKHDEDREAEVIIYSVAELLREAKKEIQVVPSVETPWIVWSGVGTPVSLPTKAEFKFRSGETEVSEYPHYYRWEHYNNRDIVAYRAYVPSVASQEAITDVSESKPSVGIDSDTSGYKEPTEPLVSIVKDVKYTVTIKGVNFTFTQDQVNDLVSELEGFVDYE